MSKDNNLEVVEVFSQNPELFIVENGPEMQRKVFWLFQGGEMVFTKNALLGYQAIGCLLSRTFFNSLYLPPSTRHFRQSDTTWSGHNMSGPSVQD